LPTLTIIRSASIERTSSVVRSKLIRMRFFTCATSSGHRSPT